MADICVDAGLPLRSAQKTSAVLFPLLGNLADIDERNDVARTIRYLYGGRMSLLAKAHYVATVFVPFAAINAVWLPWSRASPQMRVAAVVLAVVVGLYLWASQPLSKVSRPDASSIALNSELPVSPKSVLGMLDETKD
jgi:hypothetical protein